MAAGSQDRADDGLLASAEARWVAVAWGVDGQLVAIGPLAKREAAAALLGAVEAHPGSERVGVAELVSPEDAAARLAQVRPKGRAAAGVLRPLPRGGEETP